jgi:hypothetical protein
MKNKVSCNYVKKKTQKKKRKKKTKIELPPDPAIPLLGINLKKYKSGYSKDTCTPMFITALFTITKLWKQPRYFSTDEWIKKM